jgi:crotonobetainyl-CoA:carnitine CoA-transferase CaiB-like acyl-CoA transferase
MKLELKSDDAVGGVIPGIRTPIVIDSKPMASPNPAPKLGQHTQEVLKEIGEA